MFACIPCALCFENGKAQYEHSKSDYHAYNLRRRVAGDEPLSKAEFDLRHQLLTETFSKTVKVKPVKTTRALESGARIEYSICRSLFCSRVSADIAENLEYMRKRFSFNFYEALAVKDPESLLNLLGNLIYKENRCIWCDKKFGSLQAVQAHMTVKGHRRQGHMFEEQIDRYRPFYDPSLAKSRLMSTTPTTIEKLDQDDEWELVGEDLHSDEDTEKTITPAYEILSPRTHGTDPPSPITPAKEVCQPEMSKIRCVQMAYGKDHKRARATQRMLALSALVSIKKANVMDLTASKISLTQQNRLMCASRMRRQNFNTRMRKKRIFAV